MIKLKSLNSRLLIAFSVLSTTTCLFFIQLSTLLVEQATENAFHQVLTAEAAHLSQAFANSGQIISANSAYIQVYHQEQEVLDLVSHEKTPLITYNGVLTRVPPYLILKQSLDTNTPAWFVVNTNKLKGITPVSDYMMLFLYSISAGVIVLTLLSSWYLAKLLSSPIRNLTQGVINKAQLDQKQLYGLQRSDEIGTLAKAFEQTFNELQEALNREKNFTRDVSHELRTPITLIKNTLAINKGKAIEADATNVIEQASQELEQTVEVLLALARQENLTFEPCPILPIIEKTILAIYTSYPQLVFEVRIDICPKLNVIGNSYLISLLCQNLVNNGFYHGNDGGMTIKSDANMIIFENNIDGKEERPYYQGLGHGQYLVRRIAQEMGWLIDIEQTASVYRVRVQTEPEMN